MGCSAQPFRTSALTSACPTRRSGCSWPPRPWWGTSSRSRSVCWPIAAIVAGWCSAEGWRSPPRSWPSPARRPSRSSSSPSSSTTRRPGRSWGCRRPCWSTPRRSEARRSWPAGRSRGPWASCSGPSSTSRWWHAGASWRISVALVAGCFAVGVAATARVPIAEAIAGEHGPPGWRDLLAAARRRSVLKALALLHLSDLLGGVLERVPGPVPRRRGRMGSGRGGVGPRPVGRCRPRRRCARRPPPRPLRGPRRRADRRRRRRRGLHRAARRRRHAREARPARAARRCRPPAGTRCCRPASTRRCPVAAGWRSRWAARRASWPAPCPSRSGSSPSGSVWRRRCGSCSPVRWRWWRVSDAGSSHRERLDDRAREIIRLG